MRLYLSGLLTGLLIMFVAWSCAGPIGGNDGGTGDAKNGDTGISVGALSVKEMDLDCSKAVKVSDALGMGIKVEGIAMKDVMSSSILFRRKDSQGFSVFGGGNIVQKDSGETYVLCTPSFVEDQFTLRLVVK